MTTRLAFLWTLGFAMHTFAQDSRPAAADRWMKAAPPVPELEIPASVEAWETRRAGIRATLWKLLGNLPPRPAKPQVKTISREVRPGYIVEKFEFDNGAGATIPGYLVLPEKAAGPVPAILYCHWHGGEYPIGKEEIFRADHTPEPPAPALARRGYAVLCIDAYGFGERNGQGPGGEAEKGGPGEMSASKFQLWWGRSLWGMMLRDELMALDYLVSRPEVDARRVGVTGISMGATRTWWLMALDERLKAGVAVACLTRYQELTAAGGLKYHGIYYFVPGMLAHFDSEAVVACAAPRPLLCMNGDSDAGSPVEGIREIEKRVARVYSLYGNSNSFRSEVHEKTGHVYLPVMWTSMFEWMDRHVRDVALPQ
ncbi:MAG: dienelactone hydrolase [Verrucomicrobia bacterium]|nr:dienelactone hydrolase [Verrucomicrobiota bacterium]